MSATLRHPRPQDHDRNGLSLTPRRVRPRAFRHLLSVAVVGWSVSVAAAASAQEIPAPEYVTYVPREQAAPVTQTDASARFRLFGDPGDPAYRDQSPRDGIDDARNARFLELAERFAPWLRRNAYGFPMDVRRFMTSAETFPLVIDEFNLARSRPVLLRSDSLDFARLGDAPCPAGAPPDDLSPDCRLRRLLAERGPQAPVAREPAGADSERVTVMYFNFPGESPATWAEQYEGKGDDTVDERYLGWAKAWVHPFIAEAGGQGADARYEFVLQYWFYYPTNDAGNAHEGDWEHLNVVVAPRAAVTRPLAAAEVERLLAGAVPDSDLVIRRVEYYFHHWVMPLDYSRPNVYAPRETWEREVESLEPTRRGEEGLWRDLRRNAYLDEAETRLNLHPFVFIGGAERGLSLVLSAPTRLGRSSHGSFPFPGLYKAIGPAGTGESIDHPWDAFRSPPAADAPESERLVRYDNPARLEILPDWERLTDLALADPAVRREWAWFLLPARLGYPATESPFAGVVRYAETGNLSIPPPIYSGGWNRLGDGAGFSLYQPHTVAGVFPADVQDTFQPSWGFLNLTLPTLSLLPPLDILFRALEPPVRTAIGQNHPTYFLSEDLPFRGIGIGGGATLFDPGDDFWRLLGLPELATPFLQKTVALTGSITGVGLLPVEQEFLSGWRGELSLHLGKHFVSTNGLGHGRAGMRVPLVFSDGSGTDEFTAELNFWEYTGSLRWNLATQTVEPFLMGGYGLSWYRLENATAFGEILGDGNSRWIRKPGLFENLLPNTWHIGAGIELLPVRSVGAVDLSLKASTALHIHDLGLETGDATTVFFQNATIKRWVFNIVGTVSY